MGHENWRADDPFDEHFRRMTTWMGVWLVGVIVIGLSVLGFGIWAGVHLVQWLVTK